MNEDQLEGMRARAAGEIKESNPHRDEQRRQNWGVGFELMDQQIGRLLENAQQMLDSLRRARDSAARMSAREGRVQGQIQGLVAQDSAGNPSDPKNLRESGLPLKR